MKKRTPREPENRKRFDPTASEEWSSTERAVPPLEKREVTLEHVESLLSEARLPDVDESLVTEALDRVLGRAPLLGAPAAERPPRRLETLLETLRAALVGDSLIPSLATRGNATANPRVLLYEARDLSISLSLMDAEESGCLDLLGQVIPHSGPLEGEAAAVLTWAGGALRTRLTAAGEFRFTGIPKRSYGLEIVTAKQVVSLGPLESA